MSELTRNQLERALPKKVKVKVTDELVATINELSTDPQLRESYRDNLLSYTGVMAEGRYKLQDYLNAVQYVSYKLLGSPNIEAYAKTFPDRYERLVSEGADARTISSYSTAYNKNQLVNKIIGQALVPTHILNADLFQKALNTQARLMTSANSEKVQCDAANSLLTHLKQPETQKIELDIGIKGDKSIEELRATTLQLAEQQRKMIEEGLMQPVEVAHSSIIIEGEVEEVEE